MKFSDLNNKYVILDYLCSHNQLLLRSMKNANRNHNIDIIFKGVNSLLIPSSLMGIEIKLLDSSSESFSFLEKFEFQYDKNYKIFELDSQNKTYYINAMGFFIYHNELDILETSIGRYDMGDLKEIVFSY